MRIPPLPRKNDSIEQTVREIIAYLRWSNITSVVGGELRRTPNGGTLTIEPGKPGVGVTAVSYPFKISDASNEIDGCRVTLEKGMVETPYGLGPYPSNLWPEPDAPLYLPVTADVMWVRLVSTITTGEEPAVSSMVLDIVPALANDTATVAYLPIGRVTSELVEGTRRITGIFNNVRDNLAHSLAFEGYSYPDYWRQMIGPIS